MGTPITRKFFHDGADVIADYDASSVLKSRYLTPLPDENIQLSRELFSRKNMLS